MPAPVNVNHPLLAVREKHMYKVLQTSVSGKRKHSYARKVNCVP